MFQASPAATGSLFEQVLIGSTICEFQAGWTVVTGRWSFTIPSAGAWHHLAVNYNASASGNDPTVYVDGVLQSLTEVAGPEGMAIGAGAGMDFYIGNSPSPHNRCWNGRIAEFFFNLGAVTEGEIKALAGGYPPARLGRSMSLYLPLYGLASPEPNYAGVASRTGAIAGTSTGNHAPIMAPWGVSVDAPEKSLVQALLSGSLSCSATVVGNLRVPKPLKGSIIATASVAGDLNVEAGTHVDVGPVTVRVREVASSAVSLRAIPSAGVRFRPIPSAIVEVSQ